MARLLELALRLVEGRLVLLRVADRPRLAGVFLFFFTGRTLAAGPYVCCRSCVDAVWMRLFCGKQKKLLKLQHTYSGADAVEGFVCPLAAGLGWNAGLVDPRRGLICSFCLVSRQLGMRVPC